MAAERTFWVYIVASKSGVLYVGVTGNIVRRVHEHRPKTVPGFTAKYNVRRLVWLESHGDAAAAIAREKQIKAWRRSKKIALIESLNPQWRDMTPDLE